VEDSRRSSGEAEPAYCVSQGVSKLGFSMTKRNFMFVDEDTSHNVAVHASIPADIASKQSLLSTLAQQLVFPDYFGWNWDALEECIRDLSWLPAGEVVLIHADVPLLNDIANARMYLAILHEAVRKTADSVDHPLIVTFPEGCRGPVEWLLCPLTRGGSSTS
jgi:RNAse (barnase) inhibitor barstar